MGNLVNELNVKQDREGSQAPLVLGPGEGLSSYLLTPFMFAVCGVREQNLISLCVILVGLSE